MPKITFDVILGEHCAAQKRARLVSHGALAGSATGTSRGRYRYMLIHLEPYGGIAIVWPRYGLSLLVDPLGECWVVLHGRPLVRRAIPRC